MDLLFFFRTASERDHLARASSSFANTALTRPERISASISAPNTRTISKDARANATLQFASAAAAAAAATSPSP